MPLSITSSVSHSIMNRLSDICRRVLKNVHGARSIGFLPVEEKRGKAAGKVAGKAAAR
jgi:hypothetical protein